MKLILTSIMFFGLISVAHAGALPSPTVPEISALAGFAALGLVGSVAALIWERRNK